MPLLLTPVLATNVKVSLRVLSKESQQEAWSMFYFSALLIVLAGLFGLGLIQLLRIESR
jgi:hypothetical protein